jgi:hypothetical protein
VPRPVGVRATRTAGGNVIVTWRTRFPARRMAFIAMGRRSRTAIPRFGPAFAFVPGMAHTRFTTTLRADRGQTIRWISVEAYSLEGARSPRAVLIPVGR